LRSAAKGVNQPEAPAAKNEREHRDIRGLSKVASRSALDRPHGGEQAEGAKRQGEQIETSGRE
jgi:hypothetical protein